tara:strand:+ start:886 stop:1350 length:465 start_codon:yes stop_codon:yes gene_type:complete
MKMDQTHNFTTKLISSELTHHIRKNILWPHIKNDHYSLDVDELKDTFHLGVFTKSNLISIGTFVKENNDKIKTKNQYRLRAMATDKSYQKKGAGKILLSKGIDLLIKKKINLLWCSSRLHAIPFYTSLNMKCLDEVYNIEHIGLHKTMYLYLNK